MKVLVYGAGPLGSVFAAQLQQGGNDVSILARGKRISEIREFGIVLENVWSKQRSVTQVPVVEELAPDDVYDLILVIMRKNNALDILPVLAANKYSPNVLFLMNNAAGPDALVEALGAERVLIGFPNAAGYREGHEVHCIVGSADEPSAVPFGEVDGSISERTRMVAGVLESAPGLGAEIRTDMDAWLKTHVALLFPALAPALFAAGIDNYRLARTRDLVVLTARGVREALQVLRALGTPITPAKYRVIELIPEPLLVLALQKLLQNEMMETALVRHAEAARDEVTHLTGEFMELARQSGVPTPAIDRLQSYRQPEAVQPPEGSQDIPMRWGGVILLAGIVAAATATLAAGVAWLVKRANKWASDKGTREQVDEE